MAEQVNTDAAAPLALYFRKNRDSVTKTFSFFEDDGETPYSIAGLTFQMNFKNREYSATNIFQLTSGSGLTVGSSTIAFTVTAAKTLLVAGEMCWW
jgi:hypothetical protein